jgi:hypothetical protein
MKAKVSEAEMIRRLKEVTADEDKYFPGVLGSPVTFAARWGLPLSKGYRNFKAKQLAAQKRRWARARNSRHTLLRGSPRLTFPEFETRLSPHIRTHLENENLACIWQHVRVRIGAVNRQGPNKIARVRAALLDLKLTLAPKEEFAFNRFEPGAVIHWLDREVFGT